MSHETKELPNGFYWDGTHEGRKGISILQMPLLKRKWHFFCDYTQTAVRITEIIKIQLKYTCYQPKILIKFRFRNTSL